MKEDRISRVLARLQNLPSISLPTDYPRPTGTHKLIEAAFFSNLSEKTALSLLKLALYAEEEPNDDDSTPSLKRPSAFHFLLTAFTVLLHRYTADTDIIIGS